MGRIGRAINAALDAAELLDRWAWQKVDAAARWVVRLTTRRLCSARRRRRVHSRAYLKAPVIPLRAWYSTADRN